METFTNTFTNPRPRQSKLRRSLQLSEQRSKAPRVHSRIRARSFEATGTDCHNGVCYTSWRPGTKTFGNQDFSI